jgi:DNA-binding response OmpR family regulator
MSFKVLTVDDSRTIRMIVKKAFKPYECELFEAENGSEGLAAASKIHPDLIILDITMPVMTGIEMLIKMKEQEDLKDIPVIMLTAESGKDNVMQIVKMGVKDYVVKPFKGEQLIARVQNVLDLTERFDDEAISDAKDSDASYFSTKGDVVVLTLPQKVTRSVSANVETAAKTTISKAISAGVKKYIIDISKVANISMTAIQVIISQANNAVRNKMTVRLVASENQTESLKGFKETSALTSSSSIEAAVSSFS